MGPWNKAKIPNRTIKVKWNTKKRKISPPFSNAMENPLLSTVLQY
jgi:hypothetical protein